MQMHMQKTRCGMWPSQARRRACNATIKPWVWGGDSEVLDAGRASRLFQPIQRKALRLQAKCCQAEGCDMPPEWCDAHHLEPWAAGGKTNLKDGALLCPHHHRLAHNPAYVHERLPDGTIRFTRRP
jgi:hypothetical protein